MQVAGHQIHRQQQIQLRSGDACEIGGYCGAGVKLVRALRDFACQYADQTDADYAEFMAAIKRGKIKVIEAEG